MGDEYRISVLIALGVVQLFFYGKFSQKIGSYFNVITPYFVLSFIKNIIVEILYISNFGGEGGLLSFHLVAAGNSLEIVAIVVGFMMFRGKDAKVFVGVGSGYKFFSIILFVVAIILFLPVYAQFGNSIFLDSRSVYMETRTGYGVNYFFYIFLLKLSFIFSLFWLGRSLFRQILLLVFYGALGVITGSKAAVLIFVVILFVYRYCSQNSKKYGLESFALVMAAGFVVMGLAVVLLKPSQSDVELEDMVSALAVYADYNRNAQVVIDDNRPLEFGKIIFEDYVISKVPRFLYPDKPKDFGSFSLAAEYFPQWFMEDTGSPSFGVGALYADFGSLFLVWIAISSAIQGWILGYCVYQFNRNKNPYWFVFMLSFAGFSLLTAGVGSFIFEVFAVMAIIRFTENNFPRLK